MRKITILEFNLFNQKILIIMSNMKIGYFLDLAQI